MLKGNAKNDCEPYIIWKEEIRWSKKEKSLRI